MENAVAVVQYNIRPAGKFQPIIIIITGKKYNIWLFKAAICLLPEAVLF